MNAKKKFLISMMMRMMRMEIFNTSNIYRDIRKESILLTMSGLDNTKTCL
jgi:hypothetical protein